MKTYSNVTKVEADEVVRIADQCLKILARKEYEIGFKLTDAKRRMRKVLTVRKTPDMRSRAGANNIVINLECWQRHNKAYAEYKRFNHDSIIGGRPVSGISDVILITIAHEIAHHVQFAYIPRSGALARRLTDRKPHGVRFKYCYRILRRELVNPIIDHNLALAKLAA